MMPYQITSFDATDWHQKLSLNCNKSESQSTKSNSEQKK